MFLRAVSSYLYLLFETSTTGLLLNSPHFQTPPCPLVSILLPAPSGCFLICSLLGCRQCPYLWAAGRSKGELSGSRCVGVNPSGPSRWENLVFGDRGGSRACLGAGIASLHGSFPGPLPTPAPRCLRPSRHSAHPAVATAVLLPPRGLSPCPGLGLVPLIFVSCSPTPLEPCTW